MNSDPDWSLAENDPRAFFGLAEDATLTDLKRAYARLIKVWKPDKFPSEFKKIRRAFEELEHEFKLEAPPIDLDQAHFLRSPEAAAAASESETPTRLRPDFPSAPSLDWTARLHDSGVEATLAEMEKLGRLEPRDWLLLASLREAQNPDEPALFARTLIEALRHHADDPELWHALLIELRRQWQAREVEALCGELLTLHHHADFLRRCHAFWMYAFEVAPAANLCPLLDRFLHRAHGKAHQEEASFVLEVLMRFGPALPAEWIRLQTSFYEQIWGPSLQGFASDLEQLPLIQAELEKTDDPAARRLLDFFAAWGRHDLPELHLSRLDLRQLLLQRPEKAKPLLSHSELFLPASRLLSFRSRNLRGGQIAPPERQVLLGIRSGSAEFLHYLTLVTIPLLAGLLWFLSTQFHSTEVLPFWLVAIGALWIYVAPRIARKIRELWQVSTLIHLIKNFWRENSIMELTSKLALPVILFTLAISMIYENRGSSKQVFEMLFGVCFCAFLLWRALDFFYGEECRKWIHTVSPAIKLSLLTGIMLLVSRQTGLFLLELSDRNLRGEQLGDLLLLLMLLCLVIDPRGLYDSFYSHFTRIFETIFRQSAKPRVLASIALHQLSLQLWHHKLTENQKKLTRPLISDGDVHLAAAIWEAPRNRGED